MNIKDLTANKLRIVIPYYDHKDAKLAKKLDYFGSNYKIEGLVVTPTTE